MGSFLKYVPIEDNQIKVKKNDSLLLAVLPISILWFFKKKKNKIHPY